jgi:hypothetical protein
MKTNIKKFFKAIGRGFAAVPGELYLVACGICVVAGLLWLLVDQTNRGEAQQEQGYKDRCSQMAKDLKVTPGKVELEDGTCYLVIDGKLKEFPR